LNLTGRAIRKVFTFCQYPDVMTQRHYGIHIVLNNQEGDPNLLVATGLCKCFGGIHAVDHAEISVARNSITGLIGPNGAGKTTLFNLLCNFIPPDQGRVIFDGEPISHLPPHQVALQGLWPFGNPAH